MLYNQFECHSALWFLRRFLKGGCSSYVGNMSRAVLEKMGLVALQQKMVESIKLSDL